MVKTIFRIANWKEPSLSRKRERLELEEEEIISKRIRCMTTTLVIIPLRHITTSNFTLTEALPWTFCGLINLLIRRPHSQWKRKPAKEWRDYYVLHARTRLNGQECVNLDQITEAYHSLMHVQIISKVVQSTNKPKSTRPPVAFNRPLEQHVAITFKRSVLGKHCRKMQSCRESAVEIIHWPPLTLFVEFPKTQRTVMLQG